MKITKIKDLTAYELATENYESFMRKFEPSKFDGAEYYDADEVEELVSYLQSKLIIWKITDEEAAYSQNIIILWQNNTLDLCRVSQSGGKIYSLFRGKSFSWSDEKENMKYWCYLDDLLKTLPENQ